MSSKKKPRVTFRRARDGWRWRVRARNGKVVAESGEAYVRRDDAETGAAVAATLLGFWLQARIR